MEHKHVVLGQFGRQVVRQPQHVGFLVLVGFRGRAEGCQIGVGSLRHEQDLPAALQDFNGRAP